MPFADLTAETWLAQTDQVAVERVLAMGLRLSTPDEWEYACGSGATHTTTR